MYLIAWDRDDNMTRVVKTPKCEVIVEVPKTNNEAHQLVTAMRCDYRAEPGTDREEAVLIPENPLTLAAIGALLKQVRS